MVMMKGLLLDTRIAFSNRLCDLQVWLEERQHPAASRRVQRFRCWLDRAWCRLLGHPRIIYGPMRDICLDCLTIVDEHPDGRGHEPDPQRKGMPKCPRCGDIAFRPDPVDWRKPAWRCGGCHRVLGRCICAALATAKEAGNE